MLFYSINQDNNPQSERNKKNNLIEKFNQNGVIYINFVCNHLTINTTQLFNYSGIFIPELTLHEE